MRLLLIGMALGLAVVPTPASWVESMYSRQTYLISQNLLTPLSSLTPIALFDVLIVFGVIGLPVWWVLALRRSGRGRRLRAAARMVLNTATLAAVMYVVFLLVWGLNYRREPLTAKLDYHPQRVTPLALADLAGEATVRLNALHTVAHTEPWSDLDALPSALGPAFVSVQRELGVSRTAVTGTPKVTLLTPYFRRAGVDGMINPFSLEILINGSVLPFERPFVVAHEWAHLAGYANESEASFVGWLTCLTGPPPARYSAWVFLFPHLIRHLDQQQQDELWAKLDEGPMADFRAVSERVAEAVPVVRRGANRVYDQYLKANRVDEGIASYGAVVDLVLGSALGDAAIASYSGDASFESSASPRFLSIARQAGERLSEYK
jgi:hypothetical protein